MRLNATAMMVFSLFLFSIKYQIAFDAFSITSKKPQHPAWPFFEAQRSGTIFCE